MQTTLAGSHLVLSVCPIYISIIFYAVQYIILRLLRLIFEGKGYDVSLSSKYGDPALVAFITLCAWIIKLPNFHPSPWMENTNFHLLVAFIGIAMPVIYLLTKKPKQWGDRWHALVMFPTLFYFVSTTLPILLKYVYVDSLIFANNLLVCIAGLSLLVIWGSLVMFDTENDRMNQRRWIKKNRRDWKLKN